MEIFERNKGLPMATWVKVEYLGKKEKARNSLVNYGCWIRNMQSKIFGGKKKVNFKDTDFIEILQIIENLNEPTFNNRGHYFFGGLIIESYIL